MLNFDPWAIAPDDGGGWKLGKPSKYTRGDGTSYFKWTETTYHSRLEHAFRALLERRIHDSDPSSIQDVLDEIAAFRNLLGQMFTIRVEVADGGRR